MGTLGWPEFTAPIIAAMSAEGGGFLCEEGETALTRIGELAQAELISRWDGLDSSQRIYGMGVIERIGGDAAVDFALTRFDTLFNDDAENWCAIAENAPDPRLLQRLGPHLQRHQLHIDKCYYIIAKLLGIDNSDIDQLSKRLHAQRTEQRARQDAAHRGEWFTASLNLELECSDCGQTND